MRKDKPSKEKSEKAPKEVKNAFNICSTFSAGDLHRITTEYFIDQRYKLLLPKETDTIRTAPAGYEPVYFQFLLGGLRFPIDPFILAVLQNLEPHIAQLAPNSLRKVIGFIMLCRSLGIPLSVPLFRFFYTVTGRGDWSVLAHRPGQHDCITGLRDSIHWWKYSFFYVDCAAFNNVELPWGKASGRGSDPVPDLTPEERVYADKISTISVEWEDPDETFLGMANLSPYYFHRDVTAIWKIDDRTVSLLERLQMKKGSSPEGVVTVEEGEIVPFLPPVEEIQSSEETIDLSTTEAEGARQSGDVLVSDPEFCTEGTMIPDSQVEFRRTPKTHFICDIASAERGGSSRTRKVREEVEASPLRRRRIDPEGLSDCVVVSDVPATIVPVIRTNPVVSFRSPSFIPPSVVTASTAAPTTRSGVSSLWKLPTGASSSSAIAMFESQLFSSGAATSSMVRESRSPQSARSQSSLPPFPTTGEIARNIGASATVSEIIARSGPFGRLDPPRGTVSVAHVVTVSPIISTTPVISVTPVGTNIPITFEGVPDTDMFSRVKFGLLSSVELISELQTRSARHEQDFVKQGAEFERISQLMKQIQKLYDGEVAKQEKLSQELARDREEHAKTIVNLQAHLSEANRSLSIEQKRSSELESQQNASSARIAELEASLVEKDSC